MPSDPPERWQGRGLEAWQAWTPEEAAARLRDVVVPWCVVGGWAIDLWLGRQTREHEDLEIAILRPDLRRVRAALAEFRLHAVGDGEVIALADDETTPADKHQNWLLDVTADAWRMDIMLEPGDEATWVFRRDEAVRRPRSEMIGRSTGIPFLRPEGVLLYKAKAARPKDVLDFNAVLPTLDAPARVWLRESLARIHPGHTWITLLG